MKNLISIMCVCVVIGCGGDKINNPKDERLYGEVKEIHTYSFDMKDSLNINTKEKIWYDKVVDSFDISGNKIKETSFWNKIDINDDDLKYKLFFSSKVNYDYDKKMKLVNAKLIFESEKLGGRYDFEFINDTTILINSFNGDNNLESKFVNFLNKDGLIYNSTSLNRDSVKIMSQKIDFNSKGFIIKTVNKDSLERVTVNSKHLLLKFDKNGNWIKKYIFSTSPTFNFNQIIIRDIFYYK
jgi:hypothetical protein